VPLHVKGEMIGTRETPLAEVTLERFLAGVFAIVASQLV
jgi:hypothetical protein